MIQERSENSIKCIEMGDSLFARLEKEYSSLKRNEKYLSQNEVEKTKRILGTQYGLVCEYYLKGIILASHKIEASQIKDVTQEELKKIEEVLNSISEEDEYNLIIGNIDTLNRLREKFQLSKKIITILSKQSLKKIGGNGHDLGALFEYLSDDKKNIVLANMVDYYSEIENPITKEEWEKFLSGFLRMNNSKLRELNYQEGLKNNKSKLNELIEEPKVSDAFFNGRYGHLENYLPDTEALHHLSKSIRESVKREYRNAISLTDGIEDGYIDANTIRYIFPDMDSKIYVFDSGKELTRVYGLMKYGDFARHITNNTEAFFDNTYTICPEFGIDKMKEISYDSSGKRIIDNGNTPYNKTLHVSPSKPSIIICTVNGKEKIYIYTERKFSRRK